MNRYERIVEKLSQSVITTAERLSESIVSIILALVAIISAIPEFWGLWEVSGEWMLGLAIAAMGAAGAHVAVWIGKREAWYVLAGHVVIAELTILWYGGGVELIFPFVTIIGALIMSLSATHAKEAQETAAEKAAKRDERKRDKADRKALEREIRLLKAQAEADAIRSGVAPQNVHGTSTVNVHGTSTDALPTSGRGVSPDAQRKQIVSILMDKGETSVSSLMSALDAPRSTVNKRLVELREAGKVVNENRKWAIAPAVISPAPEIEIHTNGVSA